MAYHVRYLTNSANWCKIPSFSQREEERVEEMLIFANSLKVKFHLGFLLCLDVREFLSINTQLPAHIIIINCDDFQKLHQSWFHAFQERRGSKGEAAVHGCACCIFQPDEPTRSQF